MASDPSKQGPRNNTPHTLEGLLKLSMGLTGQNSDNSAKGEVTPMNKEKQDILNHVLNDMAKKQQDFAQGIQAHIHVIRNRSSPDEQISESLEFLAEWVEDIDDALSLHAHGGFVPTVALLDSPNAEHQWLAAEVIGNMTQNNPPCQEVARQFKVLKSLMPLLDTDRHKTVRVKALRAINCIVRSHAVLTASLVESENSLGSILLCLAANDVRLRTKALFFVTYLIAESDVARDAILSHDVPATVVSTLEPGGENNIWEQSLALLYALVRSFHDAPKSGKSDWGPRFLELLQHRRDHLESLSAEDQDACMEEIDLGNKLECLIIGDANSAMR